MGQFLATVNSISRLTLWFLDFSGASSCLTRALGLGVQAGVCRWPCQVLEEPQLSHGAGTVKWITLNPRQTLGPTKLLGARGKARQWDSAFRSPQGPGISLATGPSGCSALGATGITGPEGRWRQLLQLSRARPACQGTGCHPSPRRALLWECRPHGGTSSQRPTAGPSQEAQKEGRGSAEWRMRKGGQGALPRIPGQGPQHLGEGGRSTPTRLQVHPRASFRDPLQNLRTLSESPLPQSRALELAWTGKLVSF